VHLEQHRRARGGVPRVVVDARAVRRADLAQPAAAGLDDLGHPEAAADLDELGAAHQHVAPRGERVEREQQRAGAVVHHERRIGAGEQLQPPPERGVAVAAALRGRVPFEVGVTRQRAQVESREQVAERGAAEVRVDQHSGTVDHAARRGARQALRLGGAGGDHRRTKLRACRRGARRGA
jgi:hypothetical protein